MATITGLTADRMLAIEAASVIDGDVVGDDLILTTKGGQQINAGNVRGPEGDQGPIGSDLVVVSSKQLLDVGVSGQIRAGRQLTATDFTNMGLSAPAGLWNLSNLNDSSGNGRNLSNKGAVPFITGIDGVASSAAQFAGSTAQVLYINDTGASDPFRIRSGSFGCWFRAAKRVADQMLMAKDSLVASNRGWHISYLATASPASIQVTVSNNAGDSWNSVAVNPSVEIGDDCWHFVVGVFDGGRLYIYMDGILEASTLASPSSGSMAGSSAPLNIGGRGGDGSTAPGTPFYGRIDEAFVTSDVLSEDQVRNLYCAKIPHTLSAIPKRVGLNVRRRKKGAALASSDFPTPPLRLYNFSAGSLNDEGSNGQILTNNGGALSVPGVDGSLGNAFNFNTALSQTLSSTDAGLPSGLTSRSYGAWFKQSALQTNAAVMAWGLNTNACTSLWIDAGGLARSRSYGNDITGPFVCDGVWHFGVVTEDNAAFDGMKRKMYIDGREVGIANLMNSSVLVGANGFNIGRWGAGVAEPPFHGQIDGVFVCGYTLDAAHIAALYAKGSQSLGVSPKNPGDHIEMMTSTDLLCAFDTLDSQELIDLVVA